MLDRDLLNRLYRYSYVLTGDESAAYDLLQDAVERFLRCPPAAVDSQEAYLRRILRNRFIDLRRRAQRLAEEPLEAATEGAIADLRSLESVVIAEKDLEDLWPRLSPLEREILYLWALEDCSAGEIALRVGRPRSTVLSQIHRLRKRMSAAVAGGPGTRAKGPRA